MLRSWPIQQAIHGTLTGDATLTALINGVFDNPDQNTQPPYVTLGESTSTPDDLLVETGSQETLTLQVWTKDGGMAKCKQIMQRVYTLLHRQTIAVSGTQTVECRCEIAEAVKESDGETRRGLMRFRVVTFG
jgi:hypothetical protein